MIEVKFKTKKITSHNFQFRVFNKSGAIGSCICEQSDQLKLLALKLPLEQQSWIIHEIEIQEKHRYKGIGTQLLRYAIAQMESIAPMPIVLIPAHEGMNTLTLLHWFRKHGFAQSTKGIWIRLFQATNKVT